MEEEVAVVPAPWENELSQLLVMLRFIERLLLLLEEVAVDEECVMLTSGGGVSGGNGVCASVDEIIVERWGVDIVIAVEADDVDVAVGQGGGGMPRDADAGVVVVAPIDADVAEVEDLLGSGEPLMGVVVVAEVRNEGTGLA